MTKAVFDLIRPWLDPKGYTPERIAALDAVLATLSPAAPVRDDAFIALAIEHLRAEEGVVPWAYQDHLGYWTIGVGRLIDRRKGGRLTDGEIDYLLANDIARFTKAMEAWPSWQRVKHDKVRAVAMLSMCFQMGPAGLAAFENTLGMIERGEFDKAAHGMLQSRWAKQTPQRAKRVAEMMRTGKMQ